MIPLSVQSLDEQLEVKEFPGVPVVDDVKDHEELLEDDELAGPELSLLRVQFQHHLGADHHFPSLHSCCMIKFK